MVKNRVYRDWLLVRIVVIKNKVGRHKLPVWTEMKNMGGRERLTVWTEMKINVCQLLVRIAGKDKIYRKWLPVWTVMNNTVGRRLPKESSSLGTDEEDLSNEADENAIGLVDQFLSYWKKKPVQSSECSICLELYKAGDTICVSKSPDCDHVFHEECISAWLSTNDHCPLCRVDLMNESTI
eukprot:scaffold763_cov98-Cylindrotheca_fusiformis.AAC.4